MRQAHDWTYSQNKYDSYKLTKFAECQCACNNPIWSHLEQAKEISPKKRFMAYIPAHRLGIMVYHLLDDRDGAKTWRFIIPYLFSVDLYGI